MSVVVFPTVLSPVYLFSFGFCVTFLFYCHQIGCFVYSSLRLHKSVLGSSQTSIFLLHTLQIRQKGIAVWGFSLFLLVAVVQIILTLGKKPNITHWKFAFLTLKKWIVAVGNIFWICHFSCYCCISEYITIQTLISYYTPSNTSYILTTWTPWF